MSTTPPKAALEKLTADELAQVRGILSQINSAKRLADREALGNVAKRIKELDVVKVIRTYLKAELTKAIESLKEDS